MAGREAALSPFSFLRRFYLRYRALRLPWRRKVLAGTDLQGNTFWEHLPSPGQSSRLTRRVLKPALGRAAHHGDVSISPSWHQWLRHTRAAPPSLSEQTSDLQRIARVQVLAARADEKWNRKRLAEAAPAQSEQGMRYPGVDGRAEQPGPGMLPGDQAGYAKTDSDESEKGVRNAVGMGVEESVRREAKNKVGAGTGRPRNPSGGWQPEAWTPQAGVRGDTKPAALSSPP